MRRLYFALRRLARYVWASPTTLLGVLFLPLGLQSGGGIRVVRGVVEVHGRAIAWLLRRVIPLPAGAAAITLGHIVLGRDEACLAASRDHEQVHVRQAERWGPLFVPAYLTASLWARLQGGDAYVDNHFEREARGCSDRDETENQTSAHT